MYPKDKQSALLVEPADYNAVVGLPGRLLLPRAGCFLHGPRTPAAAAGVFSIFIFFKNIFYRNIFLVSQFTVLYPYRPGGRPPAALLPGSMDLYVIKI